MRQYLSSHTVANEARLRKSYRHTIPIIVEDRPTKQMIDKFLDNTRYNIVIAHSKENVIGALSILGKEDALAFVGPNMYHNGDVELTKLSNLIVIDFDNDEVVRKKIKNALQALEDRLLTSESFQTMLASEAVLGREWNTTEEDIAWADL